MASFSPEEVRANYVAEFGDEDGPIVHRLTDAASQLALEWRVFLYLFCGPQERVDVLNRASGLTARLIQNLLWDNVLLRIRRLADPMTSRSNKNLSLEHLVRIGRNTKAVDLGPFLEVIRNEISELSAYASKYLAHSDLEHALGSKKVSIVRKDTTRAVKQIAGFVSMFHRDVRDVQHLIMPITSADDEQQFLARLHLGNVTAQANRFSRVEKAKMGEWDDALKSNIPDWILDMDFRNYPF